MITRLCQQTGARMIAISSETVLSRGEVVVVWWRREGVVWGGGKVKIFLSGYH